MAKPSKKNAARFTIVLENELMNRIAEHFCKGEDAEVSDEILAEALEYACNRKDALAKHGGKARKVKIALREGKPLPKGLTFKRYVPMFTQSKLDAEGTEKEIAVWTHKAPQKAAPAPSPKAKAERKAKATEKKIAKKAARKVGGADVTL